MYLKRVFCLIAVSLLGCAAGCQQRWRPSMELVTTQPADAGVSLDDYLRATRSGRWTYLRCSLPCSEDSDKVEYVRVKNRERMMEGRLLGTGFHAIDRYLRSAGGSAGQPSGEEVLTPPALKGAGFVFFKLEHPLEPIPRTLMWGKPDVASTELTYYDYKGRPAATGELTRTSELEGFETVTCPAGTFSNCVRVRVELEVRFPWVFQMAWSSYLWISRDMGEVRRVDHLSGWFLIFWFSSAYEYELEQGSPDIDNEEEAGLLSPRWSTGAVLFDRVAPRPVIGGMIVDFAKGSERTAATQAAE